MSSSALRCYCLIHVIEKNIRLVPHLLHGHGRVQGEVMDSKNSHTRNGYHILMHNIANNGWWVVQYAVLLDEESYIRLVQYNILSPVKLHIGRPIIHYLLYYALKCDIIIWKVTLD